MKIKLFLLNYIIKEKQYYMRVDVLLIYNDCITQYY